MTKLLSNTYILFPWTGWGLEKCLLMSSLNNFRIQAALSKIQLFRVDLSTKSREGLVQHAREVDTHIHTNIHTHTTATPKSILGVHVTTVYHSTNPVFPNLVSGTSGKSEGCNEHSKQFIPCFMEISKYMWLLWEVKWLSEMFTRWMSSCCIAFAAVCFTCSNSQELLVRS
jgi:hypothetical protein